MNYNTGSNRIEGQVLYYRPYPADARKKKLSAFSVTLRVILVAVIIAAGAILTARSEDVTTPAWVICKDYVVVRMWASRRATEVGQLDPCDPIEIDGKTKDGFAHIVAPMDGWIHAGYITFSEPQKIDETGVVVAKKRVAARRWCDGPQVDSRPWLICGSEVKVYYMSDDWACTSRGYVKSEWLEVVAP